MFAVHLGGGKKEQLRLDKTRAGLHDSNIVVNGGDTVSGGGEDVGVGEATEVLIRKGFIC